MKEARRKVRFIALSASFVIRPKLVIRTTRCFYDYPTNLNGRCGIMYFYLLIYLGLSAGDDLPLASHSTFIVLLLRRLKHRCPTTLVGALILLDRPFRYGQRATVGEIRVLNSEVATRA